MNLDEIRARAAAATRGPWRHDPTSAWRPTCGEGLHEYVWADSATDGYPVVAMTGHKGEHPRTPADAAFIAAARQDVDTLLAEVDRLNALLAGRYVAPTVAGMTVAETKPTPAPRPVIIPWSER